MNRKSDLPNLLPFNARVLEKQQRKNIIALKQSVKQHAFEVMGQKVEAHVKKDKVAFDLRESDKRMKLFADILQLFNQ